MSKNKLNFAAFVLVGGMGTRLRSVVYDRPKPMADVFGKPFLEIIIRLLAAKGINKFVSWPAIKLMRSSRISIVRNFVILT